MTKASGSATREKQDGTAPVVSVIIPAYNAAKYIRCAVGSVLAQTFQDREIIVINDGSPDTAETERELGDYMEEIIYIKQENGGPAAARNLGLRAARGEFVAFLDADDYWKSDYLSEQINYITTGGFDLVYTDGLIVGDSLLAGRTFMNAAPSVGEVTLESLLAERSNIILSGVVARRTLVIEAGLFDEAFRHGEDFDLWCRLAKIGARIAYQKRALVVRREHAGNLCADMPKAFEAALSILDKIERGYDLEECEREALDDRKRKLRAFISLDSAKKLLSKGEFASAAEAFQEASGYYGGWKLAATRLALRVCPNLLRRVCAMRGPDGSAGKVGSEMPALDSSDCGETGDASSSLTINAAWYLGGKTLAFAFNFALPLLLVRRLSQQEFGVYKQVFLVVGTAITLLPMGFGLSAFYFLPRERERKGQIAFNIAVFYLIAGLLGYVVLLIRPDLLGSIFHSAELMEYAPMIGFVALLWMVGSILETLPVANQETRLAAILIVVSQFTKGLILLAAAVSFGSVRALIYAAAVQGLLQTALLLGYMRSRFGRFWRVFEWPVVRRQLAYALPLGAASLVFRIHTDLHNFFVSHEFDAAQYAIYSIGCFNILLVDLLTDSVGSVMIPRVSYLQSLGRHREIVVLLARMARKLAALLLPVYAVLLITGREVITILFTDRYSASWPIFAINLTMVPLALMSSAYDPVIRAYEEHRYFLIKIRGPLLVALLLGLYIGAKNFGLIGAITAVVAVTVVERVLATWKAGRILEFKLADIALFKDVGKVLLATGAAALVAFSVHSAVQGLKPFYVIATCGAAFGFTYLLAVLTARVLTLGERAAIQRFASRIFIGASGRRAAPSLWQEDN